MVLTIMDWLNHEISISWWQLIVYNFFIIYMYQLLSWVSHKYPRKKKGRIEMQPDNKSNNPMKNHWRQS